MERRVANDVFALCNTGEMLKEEFLTEYGLSQNQLAKARRHFAKPHRGDCQ